MIYLLNKNNMKKLAYIATIACSMFLTTSCVDLTQEPQSFITDEDYIASMDLTGLQQAATGLYNDLWNGNYGFNCRLQRINVCADDITYRAAKANNELANYYRLSPNITANTADFDTTWSLFFAVINHSNTLINKTVLPENADQAKKFEEVLGEAYFLRGLSYFYLVRMYGDVPLILAETDASTYMPRTAVAEIYDQAIIPSLKKAVEILPAKSRSGFSSTPSKWAAEACLADAYMTMAGWPLKRGQEYYSLAAAAAKDIIDNSGLYLTEEYAELWKEANKAQPNEVMFAIHHNAKMKTASNPDISIVLMAVYPHQLVSERLTVDIETVGTAKLNASDTDTGNNSVAQLAVKIDRGAEPIQIRSIGMPQRRISDSELLHDVSITSGRQAETFPCTGHLLANSIQQG